MAIFSTLEHILHGGKNRKREPLITISQPPPLNLIYVVEIRGGNVTTETVLSLSEGQLFVISLESSSHPKIVS